jgi:hypothetical protein
MGGRERVSLIYCRAAELERWVLKEESPYPMAVVWLLSNKVAELG